MTAPSLLLDNVSRVHGTGDTAVRALDGVSLEVMPGELVAVMGPSGSGKSTLLNLAGGLDLATSGRVVIEGEDLTALNAKGIAQLRRRRVGFVFQDYNLIPSLTAAENVALPLELDGERAGQARRHARQSLDLMGLRELSDRFPDQMSGGQQQRVAIARALVGSRRLVLADEPTGALDSHTGEDVLRVLRERCDDGRRRAARHPRGAARRLGRPRRVPARRRRRRLDRARQLGRGPARPPAPAMTTLARRGLPRGAAPPPRPERSAARRGARFTGSWGVALRMARRDVRRHKGRSALIIIMVAMPDGPARLRDRRGEHEPGRPDPSRSPAAWATASRASTTPSRGSVDQPFDPSQRRRRRRGDATPIPGWVEGGSAFDNAQAIGSLTGTHGGALRTRSPSRRGWDERRLNLQSPGPRPPRRGHGQGRARERTSARARRRGARDRRRATAAACRRAGRSPLRAAGKDVERRRSSARPRCCRSSAARRATTSSPRSPSSRGGRRRLDPPRRRPRDLARGQATSTATASPSGPPRSCANPPPSSELSADQQIACMALQPRPHGHVRRDRWRAPPRHHDPARRSGLRRERRPPAAHPGPVGEQRRDHRAAAPHRPRPGRRARGHLPAIAGVGPRGRRSPGASPSRIGCAASSAWAVPSTSPSSPSASSTLAAMASAVIAALLPARRLGRLDIIGVMKGQSVSPRPSRFVFLVGRCPRRGRRVRRDLAGRAPRRRRQRWR